MIVTTEWNSPGNIYQDLRYKEVTEGIVFPYYKLKNILKDDLTYAYQTEYVNGQYVGGTHLRRPSPMVYTYNYGFNIPHTATIKKIELQQVVRQGSYVFRHNLQTKVIKLKTTASTTDGGGVNLNKSNHSVIDTAPNWSEIITEITPENSYVKLTPELINNPDFGQIFQVQGIMEGNPKLDGAERGWDDVQIAQMKIRVTYDNPEPTLNENNKKPKFTIKAAIKKTQKEKLSMEYPKQKTYVDITYERLPENGVYYGGETPQLKLLSENNIYLYGEEKYTTYLPKTQHFTTTNKKPAKLVTTVPVYPNWADNHGTVIIEWTENGELHHRYVGLPIEPWQELPDTFNEDTTSQGCIIVNNTFDSCWATWGGSYYIERCFDEIKPQTDEEKEKFNIVDAYGYAMSLDVSRYKEGAAGTSIPNQDTGVAIFEASEMVDISEATIGTADALEFEDTSIFTITDIRPNLLRKDRKNHNKKYIKIDTSASHTRSFHINPEYVTDELGTVTLLGEGMIRLEFTNPIDTTSARIKAVITNNGTTTKEDITNKFTLSDYNYDASKTKPYYIIARYNFKEVYEDEWHNQEIRPNFPTYDFEIIYYEYKEVDSWKYKPVSYYVIAEYDFKGDRSKIHMGSNNESWVVLHYTPLTRVQKPVICTTNNNHKNIKDVSVDTWCKEPTGYVKEKCITPESLKVIPTVTLTLSKNNITWSESITATVTAKHKNIPLSSDTPIPITDNTGKTLGTVTLTNGTGSVKIKPQSTDVNKIMATFTETTRFFETTVEKSITVNKITPTLTLTSNNTSPEYNTTIKLTSKIYYTDLTTNKQVPLKTTLSLNTQNADDTYTSHDVNTDKNGVNNYNHHITTIPKTYTYQTNYTGNKNINTKQTTLTINEQKGTLRIKVDPNKSTDATMANYKESISLYTQLFDANTNQEIIDAPAPFTFTATDTGASDIIITSGRNTTSHFPFTVTSNSGEKYHGELIDGVTHGYDNRTKVYHVRLISHPYYDKTTDNEFDDYGNRINVMTSNGVPIFLNELETRFKTLKLKSENNVSITASGSGKINYLPENITAEGQLQFKIPTGFTAGTLRGGREAGGWCNLVGRVYIDKDKKIHDDTEILNSQGNVIRPSNSVSFQIHKNGKPASYHEFQTNDTGQFSYTWPLWNDTSESNENMTNEIQVIYRKQQSGLFEGIDSDKITIDIRKASTAITLDSATVSNGKVTVQGKVIWNGRKTGQTNWDQYFSENYNGGFITPFIDGNKNAPGIRPNNDGTFDYTFTPTVNKHGTKPILLKFTGGNFFNDSQSGSKTINLG